MISSCLCLFRVLLRLFLRFVSKSIRGLRLSNRFQRSFFRGLLFTNLFSLLLNSDKGGMTRASLIMSSLVNNGRIMYLRNYINVCLRRRNMFSSTQCSLIFLMLTHRGLVTRSLNCLCMCYFVIARVRGLRVLVLEY